jgi:ferredoxin-like protein FixX
VNAAVHEPVDPTIAAIQDQQQHEQLSLDSTTLQAGTCGKKTSSGVDNSALKSAASQAATCGLCSVYIPASTSTAWQAATCGL